MTTVLTLDDDLSTLILDLGKSLIGTWSTKYLLIWILKETWNFSFHQIEWEENLDMEYTKSRGTVHRGPPLKRLQSEQSSLKYLVDMKKYPFSKVALVIHQAQLLMFGGCYEDFLCHNQLYSLDLSPLVPYLALEQQIAIALAKNANVRQIPEDLRSKMNLW